RRDGGGGTWSYRDPANDAEDGVREGMRGRTVCQAGADARADLAAQSLAGRKQSRRSVPQGSHGSFFKLTRRRSASASAFYFLLSTFHFPVLPAQSHRVSEVTHR